MPAISRPLLAVLIVAVVALVGFYATKGARDSGGDSAPAAPAPEASAPPADERADASAQSGANASQASPEAGADASAPDAKVPPAMAQALADRRLVVLFVYKRPGSADDRATARSVAALRGSRGVAIFADPIGRIERYRDLVDGLGIDQAPAVVIVGRDGKARVIEGYVDPATLAQDVADAR